MAEKRVSVFAVPEGTVQSTLKAIEEANLGDLFTVAGATVSGTACETTRALKGDFNCADSDE